MSANRKPASMAAVFFDLDGTLLDTASDFVLAVTELCARHTLIPPPAGAIRNTVSDGARALVQLALHLDPTDTTGLEAGREELLDIYEQVLGKATTGFAGIDATLATIAKLDLPWGIVTNKPRRFAQPLMQLLNLQPIHHILVCPDDVEHAKPHPESLLLAARTTNTPPAQCLYVGDHARDIEAGRNAGMTTVAAAYGYIDTLAEAENWAADHLIEHASELVPLINQWHANLRI